MLRIWRTPESRFGIHCEFPDDLQDETVHATDTYDDDRLRKIAEQGFNAVWVHGQLHHLVKHPLFPEFGKHEEQHLHALQALIRRAEKAGLQVFLYLQPPRAIPVSDTEFWKNHEEHGGMVMETIADDTDRKFDERALCTSHPEVRRYIAGAFASLTEKLPGLGGYIIISASEYPAHCYSRRNCKPGLPPVRSLIMDQVPTECPRCARRDPWEVVGELLQTIRDGVRSVSRETRLVFWNWSWSMYCDPPCMEIIEKLPADCILMADFERGGIRRDGVYIDEYSLGYAGPSEQFLGALEAARKKGISVMAKLQIGTTHELATVCSLPLIGNLFYKAAFIRKNHLEGFLGCWNFGNFDSANLSAVNEFLTFGTADTAKEQALMDFAHHFFPEADASLLCRAWSCFAQAMEVYPFCVPFLYAAPVNHALGLLPGPGPLDGQTVGRSWLPDPRGEDYRECLTETFPLENVIERFRTMSLWWEEGTRQMEQAFGSHAKERSLLELGNALICGAVWKSSELLFRIYKLKKNWKDFLLPEYENLAALQRENMRSVLPYLEKDPRQGLHLEGNFYSFSAEKIRRIFQ
ncbi:MAG: hypothetical protein BWY31_00607 [Lentisphaerae bacterium ADurb.Bin242]|nr:MAG: hypothetical protein BWY31_00607 [Lentisphaerae bacterium ADurb.Bin242]